MKACDHLHPSGGLRGASCATIFGLIASTGLRISEATGLTRSDVALERGLLFIRHAKFDKSRWIPLHSTTTRALRRYAQLRDRAPLTATAEAFFVFDYGRPATTRSLQYAFKQLRQRLKWCARSGDPQPRIHDIRHSFACHRLEGAAICANVMRRWKTSSLSITIGEEGMAGPGPPQRNHN